MVPSSCSCFVLAKEAHLHPWGWFKANPTIMSDTLNYKGQSK
jgi:hypothetical protein